MNEAGLKKAKMKSLAFPLLAFMLRMLLTLHALGLPCNFCSKSSFEVATRLPFYLHFQPLFDATINIMVVLSSCHSMIAISMRMMAMMMVCGGNTYGGFTYR